MTNHTTMSKISRIEVLSTGARRRWTIEEKRRIVAESYGGHGEVSATARRHGLSGGHCSLGVGLPGRDGLVTRQRPWFLSRSWRLRRAVRRRLKNATATRALLRSGQGALVRSSLSLGTVAAFALMAILTPKRWAA
jgi:hypothetical protein